MWNGKEGYESIISVTFPVSSNRCLVAVANVIGDAGNVVDEKAECIDLKGTGMRIKVSSSHQGDPLDGVYLALCY